MTGFGSMRYTPPLPKGDDTPLGASSPPPAWGVPPPLLLMPDKGGPTKRGATPAGQRKIKAQRKAKADAKAKDEMIIKARQDAAVKRAIFDRQRATWGATAPDSPFGPVLRGAGAPAKPVQSEETANSTLAAARALRLLNGGLLPPAAIKREDAAIKKVGSSRAYTRNDKHPDPQFPSSLKGRTVTPEELASQPDESVDTTRPGFFMSQMPKGYYGQGTENSLRQFEPVQIQQGIDKAFNALRPDIGPIPDNVYMTAQQLKQAMGEAFFAKAYGSSSNPAVSLKEFLTDEQRFGKYNLGVQQRKALTEMMVQRGWNAKDAPNLTDEELAARAFNNREVNLTSMLRNSAADLSMLTSFPAFVQEVGTSVVDDVKQRSLKPTGHVGQEFLRSYANMLPFLADRPYSEVVQEHPFGAAVSLLPIGKFASARAGKLMGLKGYRDVELPSARRAQEHAEAEGQPMPDGYSATRRVSASKHPIYRGFQALEDRILGQAKTPEELRAEKAGPLKRAIAKQGRKIEAHIVRQDRGKANFKASLTAGQKAHVALIKYHQSLRALPWLKNAVAGGSKTDRQRSIVFHGLIGKSSEQVSAYFRGQVEESLRLAAQAEERAKAADALEQGERQRNTTSSHYQADNHRDAAKRHRNDAEQYRKNAEAQAELAKWSDENPFDHLNPGKGEAEVMDAAHQVALQQDALYLKGERMNEKGVLWGRLQHNMAITLATEGPKFDEHGQAMPGTPLYYEALRILHPQEGLRHLHNRARELLFERKTGSEDEGATALSASHDVRSDQAQHHLGRVNRLELLQRVADAVGRQRAHRAEQRRVRAEGAMPTGEERPSLRVAQERAAAVGVGPDVLQRAIAESEGELQGVVNKGEEKAARAEERANNTRGKEAGGHSAGIARKLRVAHHDRQKMIDEGRSAADIQRQDDLIEELHRSAQEDFEPSKRVLVDESLAEKTRLLHRIRQLPERQVRTIIAKHFTPQQIAAIGPEVLHDAVMEALDSTPHLEDAFAEISARLDNAKESFIEHSGGQLPEVAQEYQQLSQHYLQRLRAYDKLLRDQGIKTGHLRLMHPEDEHTLPPIRISTGEQFKAANFGRDVHLYLGSDLQGLSAKAVEGEMYKHLAEMPWVIDDGIHEGDVPPPGFVAVSHSDWLNRIHANPDRDQLAAFTDRLKRPSEPIEGRQVWISKELRDQILEGDYLNNARRLSWLLRANNEYRKWMLYTLPRTLINNAGGNPIIAMIFGAKMKDLTEALWTLHHHPERVMGTLRGRGPISNAALEGGRTLTGIGEGINGWMPSFKHWNTFHEDNGNLMIYLMHARKAFKEENNLKWFHRVSKTNELWHDFLVKAANGENPDAFEWGKKSAQAFGDMHEHWRSDPALSSSFLFHRWVAHTIYMTLWSLPIHYPGRAAFLWNASNLADEYQKAHGIYPEWAKSLLRIPGLVGFDKLPDGLQKKLWTISTGGIWPLATPGQTLDLGDVSQPKFPGQSILAANLTPIIRVPAEIATGHRLDTLQPFKNQYGDEIGMGLDWREAINNLAANTPVVQSIWSRAGQSDNSIQILPGLLGQSHPRYSSTAKYDQAYSSPSAFGHSFWQDLLLGALGAAGASVRPLDTSGPRSERQAAATQSFQLRESRARQKRHAQADARTLNAMHSVTQRKEWFKKHDPVGFARGDWRFFSHPDDKP